MEVGVRMGTVEARVENLSGANAVAVAIRVHCFIE